MNEQFREIIIQKDTPIPEGHEIIFPMASYQPRSRHDRKPKHKMFFVDYRIVFKDGFISMYSNLTNTFILIHRIGPGHTKDNIHLIPDKASESSYFIQDDKLFFISSTDIPSWYIQFNDTLDHIFISNAKTYILDMIFYSNTETSEDEILDGFEKLSSEIEDQPLVRNPITIPRTTLMNIVLATYNEIFLKNKNEKCNC